MYAKNVGLFYHGFKNYKAFGKTKYKTMHLFEVTKKTVPDYVGLELFRYETF